MASHSDGPSTSASTTMAVNTPLTRRAASTSRPNRIPELRIRGQLSPDDLHRYRSAARGDAEENPAHAAAAKPADQPVRTDRPRIPRLQSRDHAAPQGHLNGFGVISDRTTIRRHIRQNHNKDCAWAIKPDR